MAGQRAAYRKLRTYKNIIVYKMYKIRNNKKETLYILPRRDKKRDWSFDEEILKLRIC